MSFLKKAHQNQQRSPILVCQILVDQMLALVLLGPGVSVPVTQNTLETLSQDVNQSVSIMMIAPQIKHVSETSVLTHALGYVDKMPNVGL